MDVVHTKRNVKELIIKVCGNRCQIEYQRQNGDCEIFTFDADKLNVFENWELLRVTK